MPTLTEKWASSSLCARRVDAMRTSLSLAMIGGLVTVLATNVACGPDSGPPPVPAQPIFFELRAQGIGSFGDPTGENVLFQYSGPRVAGFLPFTYQFGTTEIGQVPQVPLVFPVGQPFRMSALLRAEDLLVPSLTVPIPLSPAPYEASIFAIDVDQRFHQLGQSLSDTTWQNLTRTNANSGVVTLPDAVVLLGTRDPLGPTPQVVRFTNSSFLQGTGTQLGGGAAVPSGSGSIKSAKLMQEGLCSTVTSYDELFQQIDATIRDALYRTHGSICFKTGTEYITLAQENLAAFLGHETGAPTNARGGFLMNLAVNFRTTKFPLNFYTLADQTCHVNTTFGVEPYLDDYGVLNVDDGLAGGGVNRKGEYLPNLFTSELTSSACHGVHLNGPPPFFINFDGGADMLFDNLAHDLPNQIRAISETRQYFPALSDASFDTRPGWSCDPVQGDDRYTCPVKTDEQCGQAATEVQTGVRLAASAFGLSSSARDSLAGTITEDDGANPGHLKRWRCVSRPASKDGQACVDPHKGRCEFIVPMKRLNTRPDGIESVFFDRLDDYNNAALALFFASFLDSSNKLNPASQAFRQLCSASRPQTLGRDEKLNYSVRTFASLRGAPHRCEQDHVAEPVEPPCGKSCTDLSQCFEEPKHPPAGTCGQ